MQIGLMDTFPVVAKGGLPGVGKLLALGHNVLDRVLVYRHSFLSAVVFETPEPIAAVRKL